MNPARIAAVVEGAMSRLFLFTASQAAYSIYMGRYIRASNASMPNRWPVTAASSAAETSLAAYASSRSGRTW